MELNYVNLKAPTKRFKKDKETGDVQAISRIAFDVIGVDDETLMRIAALSDSGLPVSATITAEGTTLL
jgi:hypothetical protein